MRNLISAILVALVLMNVMGYYGLLVGMDQIHANFMKDRIDAGLYADSETLSMKIPVAGRPYAEARKDIENRLDQREVFRLVKQRLFKDTFHIVLIRDQVGTALRDALSEYALTFSCQNVDDDQQHFIILPIIIREYVQQMQAAPVGTLELVLPVAKNSKHKNFFSTFFPSIVHPPERG